MKQKHLKVGMRVWHPLFKWGTITHPPTPKKCLVMFDFTRITYTSSPVYRGTYLKSKTENLVYVPNEELYPIEKMLMELPESWRIRLMAYRPEIFI